MALFLKDMWSTVLCKDKDYGMFMKIVFLTQDTPPSVKLILIAYNTCNETEWDSKLRAIGEGVYLS